MARIGKLRALRNHAELGWRRLTSSQRVLPDFIIIGAAKAGTTSLFQYLSQHPNVLPPYTKEVHFFDYRFDRGLAWYRRHFATRDRMRRVTETTGHRAMTGEATPYYLFHPLAPERMAGVLPDIRLICLLRNPVERAVSSYFNNVRIGKETLPLEEALARERERMEGEEERLEHDERHSEFRHKYYSYQSRGLYAHQLRRWFQHYPAERLRVWQAEAFFDDPARVFAEVLEYLDLSPWRPAKFKVFNSRENRDAIDPALQARLAQYFLPHNEELYQLLGRRFDWDSPPAAG
jgi:hypothetical protein